jgi:hypothetical protein
MFRRRILILHPSSFILHPSSFILSLFIILCSSPAFAILDGHGNDISPYNVGIGAGSMTPRGKLDVDGTVYGQAMMLSSGNTVNAVTTSVSSGSTDLQLPTAAAVYNYLATSGSTVIADSDSKVFIKDGTATPINFQIDGSSSVVIDRNGNVGIGTAAPKYPLTVAYNGYELFRVEYASTLARVSTNVPGGSFWFSSQIGVSNGSGIANVNSGGAIYFNSDSSIWVRNNVDAAYVRFSSASGGISVGNAYSAVDAPASGMIVHGNVGIGSTVPRTALDVAGGMQISGLSTLTGGAVIGADVTLGSPTGNFTSANADLLAQGNIVTDSTLYGQAMMLSSGNTVNAVTTSVSSGSTDLQLPTAAAVYNYLSSASSTVIADSDSKVFIKDGTATPINFQIDGSSSMVIDSNGNVGINTSVPLAPLNVIGESRTTRAGFPTSYVGFIKNANGGFVINAGGELYVGGTNMPTHLGGGSVLGNVQGIFNSTSANQTAVDIPVTFMPASGTVKNIALNVNPIVNWGGTPGAGSYEALKISVIETSIPTGNNYLIRAHRLSLKAPVF